MSRAAVADLLHRAGADWRLIDRLLDSGKLQEVTYRGDRYYRSARE
jgi:hypothetical protein